MENTMRELNFNEIEEVSGGFWSNFFFGPIPTFFRATIYSSPVGTGSDIVPNNDAFHLNDRSNFFV